MTQSLKDLDKLLAFAGLIGRMEATLMQCDKALGFAIGLTSDKHRIAQITLARNAIQDRMREGRRLFPEPPEMQKDNPDEPKPGDWPEPHV